MNTLMKVEAMELIGTVAKIYIQNRKQYNLVGNTSCQFMARECCIILNNLSIKKNTSQTKFLERCLVAITTNKTLETVHGKNVEHVRLYSGEIPYVLSELESSYQRIPNETIELDHTPNNRLALNNFLTDIHKLLQGCNNQDIFAMPTFKRLTSV